MGTLNKPEVSRIIVGFYVGMTVFVSVIFGVVFYFIFTEAPPNSLVAMAVLVPVMILVEGVMLWAVASIYRTRYVLTENELVIEASGLIGGSKRIPLDTIQSLQRTLIPFGFRLFGASFHGGYYYLPSLGRAFMVITNYRDGVLIKAENGNYVITPSSPENFITDIEKNKLRAKTKT
jgi:hypothetical protein